MAKHLTLETLPSQFKELADVLKGGERVGWSVGSAEARRVTPSEEDWGKPIEGEADEHAQAAAEHSTEAESTNG